MNGRICRGGAERTATGLRTGLYGLLGGVAMTCLCLAATGASAAGGFYVGLGGGLVLLEDSHSLARASETYPTPFDGTSTYERGTAFTGALGYRFAGGLRVEAEVSYRKHDFDEIAVREPGSLAALLPPDLRRDPDALESLKGTHPADGDLSSVTLMVNLFHDFDVGLGLKPYVGGGIGLSRVSMRASSGGRRTTDDDDTVFAYQLGAGLGYEIGGLGDRLVVVSLDYRHIATADPTFKGSVTGTPFDTEVSGNYLGIGLRIGF